MLRAIAIARARAALCAAPGARRLHVGADIFAKPTGEHVSTFYSRTAAAERKYPSLHHDLDVNVAIVGGGLAGVNCALSLASRGKHVAVLEANRLGWAASGRNGGFVHPGFSLGMGTLGKLVGNSQARTMWQLTHDALGLIRRRVERWGAGSSVNMQPGMLTASWFDDRAGSEAEVADTNALLGREYLQFWPRERVRAAYATRRYHDGVYDPDSFHFHTLNYLQAAAHEASSLPTPARFFERAKVTEVRDSHDRKEVVLEGGVKVTADHVVIAGSAYMPGLRGGGSPETRAAVARIRRAVLPVMTYACVTEPLGDRLAEVMAAPHAVTDNRFACDYYRPLLPEGRILWGGRIDCLGISPDKLAGVLHADMCAVYPQLKDVRVEVAWPGVMGYARHKMPLIGQARAGGGLLGLGGSDAARDSGLWFCTGFGGHGLCPTAMAGELIADGIARGGEGWKMFARPFDLQWTGGPVLGALAAQAFYWGYEARDWMNELRMNGRARLA